MRPVSSARPPITLPPIRAEPSCPSVITLPLESPKLPVTLPPIVSLPMPPTPADIDPDASATPPARLPVMSSLPIFPAEMLESATEPKIFASMS
jgi:hypothetical protein